MKTILWAGLGLALSLGAMGCGKTCGPGNCSGCCDANNLCQQPLADHCGQGGGSCLACAPSQSCVLGACQLSGNGAGGTTTAAAASSGSASSATAAGSTAAGSTAAGSTGGAAS